MASCIQGVLPKGTHRSASVGQLEQRALMRANLLMRKLWRSDIYIYIYIYIYTYIYICISLSLSLYLSLSLSLFLSPLDLFKNNQAHSILEVLGCFGFVQEQPVTPCRFGIIPRSAPKFKPRNTIDPGRWGYHHRYERLPYGGSWPIAADCVKYVYGRAVARTATYIMCCAA